MSQRFVILLGLLFFSWTSPAPHGDTFEAQHEQALAANPPGVHLKISLDSAQTAFHIGDTIRLKYEFTVDSPGKYVAGARFLDHGQRSVLESFFTDRPAEARDPLHDYWDFHRAIDGNISAPREPTLKLSSSPQFDAIELTHYLRFSKPGRFRLYVVTRSALPPGAPVRDQGGPPIASENIVSIRILPQDFAAASREVDEIVARAHQQPAPRFTPIEAFRLFEIATPKARKAAASLYTRRNNYGWSDEIALATILAAPTHAEAIALLRVRLSDTTLVADQNLIQELSLLQFLQRNPKLSLLPSAVRIARLSPPGVRNSPARSSSIGRLLLPPSAGAPRTSALPRFIPSTISVLFISAPSCFPFRPLIGIASALCTSRPCPISPIRSSRMTS